MKVCRLCGKRSNQSRCAACHTKIRRYRNKKRAIELLGGKCTQCGYNKSHAALQFHHRDPSQKDFAIGNAANKSWDVVKTEIVKCDLLCANCHTELHASRDTDLALIKEAETYRTLQEQTRYTSH